jgi:hypothetical protein
MRTRVFALVLGACGTQSVTDQVTASASADACLIAPPPVVADCSGTSCPAVPIAGDAPATLLDSTFRGFGNPTLARAPLSPTTMWLAYSWPDLVPVTAPDGSTVQIGAVSTHVALSLDRGLTFGYVADLWPSIATLDPRGTGEHGLINAETPSFATLRSGLSVTWFGAHLSYFQTPKSYYFPDYASWTIRVTAASSPFGLATAEENVLGVSTTAPQYHATQSLNEVANLAIQDCAIVNNPSLFGLGSTLYLSIDCVAFTNGIVDPTRATQQLFATTPSGPAAMWRWRYVGRLGDATLAQQLGFQTLTNPVVAIAVDGTLLLMDTVSNVSASGQGTSVALELASLEPFVLRRDCAGRPIVRAAAANLGACAYDAASLSGIIATSFTNAGWMIRDTGLHP